MRAASRFGVFLCLSLVGAAPAQSVRDIPFDFRTKQPIVPISVNGGPQVPFVVDTGASIHVIDRDLAQRAKIAGGRASRLSGGGQAAVDVQFVGGLSIETHGMTWTRQRAAVAPLGYPDKKHFAGLIGAPILMRYTVQFGFAAGRLRLLDPGSYTAPPGAAIVPFELQDDLPIVRATIDAGSGPLEARLMVDTGASTFIDLNRPFVDAHQLVTGTRECADERPSRGPRWDGSVPLWNGAPGDVRGADLRSSTPRPLPRHVQLELTFGTRRDHRQRALESVRDDRRLRDPEDRADNTVGLGVRSCISTSDPAISPQALLKYKIRPPRSVGISPGDVEIQDLTPRSI